MRERAPCRTKAPTAGTRDEKWRPWTATCKHPSLEQARELARIPVRVRVLGQGAVVPGCKRGGIAGQALAHAGQASAGRRMDVGQAAEAVASTEVVVDVEADPGRPWVGMVLAAAAAAAALVPAHVQSRR